MTLYAARHAPVAVEGLCYGQHEVPVRVGPHEAAARLVAQLAGARVAEVWTSPWSRTRDLARCVATTLGAPVHCDPRLSELHFGAWEGRAYDEIARTDGARFERWMSSWQTEAPAGGESLADLVARVASWLEDVGPDSLVVTHAGVVRALRVAAFAIPWADALAAPVESLRLERFECLAPLNARAS